MSGDCYNRARAAYNKARTTEQKLWAGGVQVAAGVGGVLGWVGGTILAATGVSAVVGAVTGGSAAAAAVETGGVVAAAASADGDPTNEVRTIAERTFTLVQQEGNIVEYALKGPKGPMNIMTELVRDGNDLIMRGTHIEGGGKGTQGIRELMAFAEQFGKEQGVLRVIIEGGLRTTGANPGHLPRPITIIIK